MIMPVMQEMFTRLRLNISELKAENASLKAENEHFPGDYIKCNGYDCIIIPRSEYEEERAKAAGRYLELKNVKRENEKLKYQKPPIRVFCSGCRFIVPGGHLCSVDGSYCSMKNCHNNCEAYKAERRRTTC